YHEHLVFSSLDVYTFIALKWVLFHLVNCMCINSVCLKSLYLREAGFTAFFVYISSVTASFNDALLKRSPG
ncbi:MAG: hypothetical protein ACRCZO_03560, partial [Cetobacterium sp.]